VVIVAHPSILLSLVMGAVTNQIADNVSRLPEGIEDEKYVTLP
jgi:hypothetical protein